MRFLRRLDRSDIGGGYFVATQKVGFNPTASELAFELDQGADSERRQPPEHYMMLVEQRRRSDLKPNLPFTTDPNQYSPDRKARALPK